MCAVLVSACGGDASGRVEQLLFDHAPLVGTDDETDGSTGGSDTPGAEVAPPGSADPDAGRDAGRDAGHDAGHGPTFLPTSCPFEIEVDLVVDCGVVEVAESRADGDATIELAVAILRTPADDASPDPVVYLAGGPGGVSLAEHFVWLSGADDWRTHPILDRRDLILVDQRGTGFSRPSLWCDEESETPRRCHRRLIEAGLDLSAYSTRESAADLVDIRRSLGIDEWNLYGSSYGTRLALTALRDHPEGIRSLVLEGVYPPDVVPAYHEYVDHALRAIDELAAACLAELACTDEYGDIGDLLVMALRTADDTIGSPADAVDLMDLVFGSMYWVEGLLDIPLALDLAARGAIDDAVDVLLDGAFGFAPGRHGPGHHAPRRHGLALHPTGHDRPVSGDPSEDSAGLFHTIECREEIAFTDLPTIERRADELFEAGVDDLVLEALIAGFIYPIEGICPWWGSGTATPDEQRPAVSDVPTLLLSGRFDPITPPEWGDRAASTLGRATHVVAPNLSHGLVLEDPCIDAIVGTFLNAPEAEPDTSCVEAMRLPPFTRR